MRREDDFQLKFRETKGEIWTKEQVVQKFILLKKLNKLIAQRLIKVKINSKIIPKTSEVFTLEKRIGRFLKNRKG